MKNPLLHALVSLSLLGGAPALASGDHTPRHGGIVAEVKEIQYELVARPDQLALYVSDHGKPVAVAAGSARVTLLSGSGRQEVVLRPAGDHLAASGSFQFEAGTKAAAQVSLPGRAPASARFTLK